MSDETKSKVKALALRASEILRPRRQWFDAARRRFEEDVRRYEQRFGKTEKALRAARKAVEAEWKAVNAGKRKPRLTGDKRPAKGLCWYRCVVEQTFTRPLTEGGLPKMVGIGAWVSPQVYARLTNGPERPPWRQENPSTETAAMMCALLHDLALPGSRHFLGLRDGESSEMAHFREDGRLYYGEPFFDIESVPQDEQPLEQWNNERVREIEDHLHTIEREVPVEDAADTRQAAVASMSENDSPTERAVKLRQVAAAFREFQRLEEETHNNAKTKPGSPEREELCRDMDAALAKALDQATEILPLLHDCRDRFGCSAQTKKNLDLITEYKSLPTAERMPFIARLYPEFVLMHPTSGEINSPVDDLERWASKLEQAGHVASGTPQVAELTSENRVADDVWLPVRNLAEHFDVPQEALRKRLERLRRRNRGDSDLYIESDDRGPKDPQYLYRVGRVRSTIDALQADAASAKRPS